MFDPLNGARQRQPCSSTLFMVSEQSTAGAGTHRFLSFPPPAAASHLTMIILLQQQRRLRGGQYFIYLLIYFKIHLFIYFWLCWVFIAARGLSLVAASGGCSWLRCAGFSLRWLLLFQSMDSRHTGFSGCGTRASVVVAHRLSCSAACGIFPDQGSNPCPLHWQVDS